MDHAAWSIYEYAALRVPCVDGYSTTYESIPKATMAERLNYNFYLAHTPYISRSQKEDFYEKYVAAKPEGRDLMVSHRRQLKHAIEGTKVIEDIIQEDASKHLPGVKNIKNMS